jgi:nickel-dependent lactate racemase
MTPPRFPPLSTFGSTASPPGRPKSTPEYDQSIFKNHKYALDRLRKCISCAFIKPIATIVSNAKHLETKSALQSVINRQRLSESADATSTILITVDDPANPKTAFDVAPSA